MSSLDRFFADISSWYWWTSVVVVGLLVNLASAYLKAPMDRWLAQRSVKAADRRRVWDLEFETEVGAMVRLPSYLASIGFMEVRYRFMTLFFAALAAGFIGASANPTHKVLDLQEWAVVVRAVLLGLGVVSAALAIWAHGTAARAASLLFAAQRVLRDTGKPTTSTAG